MRALSRVIGALPLLGAALTSCTGPAHLAPAADPAGASPAPSPETCFDLRTINWANHAYPLGGASELRDGRAELREYAALGGPHDTDLWRLLSVVYGDLDGDGCDEAVPWIRWESSPAGGPSFARSTAYVWRVAHGAETLVGSAPAEVAPTIVDGVLVAGEGRWVVRAAGTLHPP